MPKSLSSDMSAADCADSVQEAVEAERLRLAQDLHDDLGGRLVALKMALAPLLQDESGESRRSSRSNGAAAAQRADRLLDDAIDAMYQALHRLRPRELDLGLIAALRQSAADFASPGLDCRFSADQSEIDAAPAVTLGLLRICREALANIAKYAQASRVDIRLRQTGAEGLDSLLLEIADDGRGYPAHAADSASIARRVQALDGIMERRAGRDGA
ncbi:MAG TPA: histidine kinase, partial [Herbaspirillum sp.]